MRRGWRRGILEVMGKAPHLPLGISHLLNPFLFQVQAHLGFPEPRRLFRLVAWGRETTPGFRSRFQPSQLPTVWSWSLVL